MAPVRSEEPMNESPQLNDPVSDILKWVLLVTAILCFALLGWATVLTYEKAPPHPQAFKIGRASCRERV